MNWFQKNFKTIIYIAFLVPIITVAVVSISHVTKWYGLSNPTSWAIYLSVGIEIAALSALAAISAQMGKKVYFPFAIVTLIQFIGNIFFAYQYIDVNSQSFKDWVDMVDPIVSFLGVESGDLVGHKRFLALFSGGMLPIISLSFLHMLVKFEEEEKKKASPNLDIPLEQLATIIGKEEAQVEEQRYKPTEEDLEELKRQLQKFESTDEEPREDKIKRLVYSKRDA
jgi:phosphoglycerol transferase MdoB-like AlkP superfamily enzyme